MNASVVVPVVGGVVVLVLVGLAVWAVRAHNRLVRLRTQVQSSWAQIDVQLRRRQALVPNLVETVKAYAAHERAALDGVVLARMGAVAAQSPGQRGPAEDILTHSIGRLFAVAEAYPDLKANQNFLALQGELGETENRIAYARQFYNSAVQSLNTAVQSIPTSLIATLAGFHQEPFFEAAAAERADLHVQF
jgi:LemA protein